MLPEKYRKQLPFSATIWYKQKTKTKMRGFSVDDITIEEEYNEFNLWIELNKDIIERITITKNQHKKELKIF